MKRFAFTLTFLTSLLAFTQEGKEKLRRDLAEASFAERFELGNDLMHDKIYQEALYVWEIMLEDDPFNANLNYKAGSCLVKLNKEKEALTYFEKAKSAVVKNYNPFSYMEKSAPPETFFYLAASNHIHGQIDTAIYQYQFFLDNTKKKHELYKGAQLGIAQCKVAEFQMENPSDYVISNLGTAINSESPEYSPVITIDGSALFFTSKKVRPDSSNAKIINIENGQYYEDVYVSYRGQDGTWETPALLGFCSKLDNDAAISVTPDGQEVFVYSSENGGDIYSSVIEDTSFLSIQPVSAEELNTEFFEPHITISADGEFMYFVSDRPGGLGGTDIWRIRKLPDGSWSKAFNLGAPINSPYDEDSPYLGVDSKTLYFSSNSDKSIGGFDIFVSQVNEEDQWSEPINMGYPLNTVDDDIFYTTTADGRIGFYSSDKLDGYGDKDIYMVETENSYIKNVTIFSGFILTHDGTQIPDGIEIFVTDLTDEAAPKKYIPRMRDGGYIFAMKPCHTYKVDYQLNKQTFYEDEIFVPCNSSYQELNHELLLDPVNMEAEATVNLADMPIPAPRWEIIGLENYGDIEGKTIKIFKDDEEVYSDIVNKFGQFNFRELDPNESYLMEIEDLEGAICKDLTANLVDSSYKVIDSYVFTFDCTTKPTVQEFSSILTTPIFQYNFGYNVEKFDSKNADLIEYAKGIKQVIDSGKEITIVASSSASKVPTRKFKSNYDLAAKRLEKGKATLIKVLKANNVDMSKVNIINGDALVQGPEYKNDASANEKVYQRYQYIKFEIQF
ncbi:MAG: hypothetical protein MK078_17045 [Crocinitomicaceae bacterium]|nr:hypothetical protein [Crocinitomicaceae bacterium]